MPWWGWLLIGAGACVLALALWLRPLVKFLLYGPWGGGGN